MESLAADVIVIGGGPAGATAATLIAMQGHRVRLLERERFPRYQIGESLLPATIHRICGMLGITDAIKSAGFPLKRGGTFLWGRTAVPWTFTFGPYTGAPNETTFAYQVERAKFDSILLDNARLKGVEVYEECQFTGVLTEGDRVSGVTYTGPSGQTVRATARHVVDASGHQSITAKQVGERVFSIFFQNVALFGYYEGGKRLPPPYSGNIFVAAFKEGWFWYIPLSPTLTSVGAVISREHVAKIQGDPEAAMQELIASCPLIKDKLTHATRVTDGMYGRLRVRKDYSYSNSSFWKPGLALVGDSACFIDPIFSTGVHLATYSAMLAARTINTCLSGSDIEESRCFREFELRYRREFGRLYDFLISFYDTNHDPDSYFWQARKILNTEESANDAFVRLVAGLSEDGEPIFTTGHDFFDARRDRGEKFMSRIASATLAGMGDYPGKPVALNPVEQHNTANNSPPKPLFRGGLVASKDGRTWTEATTDFEGLSEAPQPLGISESM